MFLKTIWLFQVSLFTGYVRGDVNNFDFFYTRLKSIIRACACFPYLVRIFLSDVGGVAESFYNVLTQVRQGIGFFQV